LPLDEAVELWRVLLTPVQSPLLAALCEYFKAQKLKQVGKDLWMQALVFLTQTRMDFSNYNEVLQPVYCITVMQYCIGLTQQLTRAVQALAETLLVLMNVIKGVQQCFMRSVLILVILCYYCQIVESLNGASVYCFVFISPLRTTLGQ
jgi:Cullin binding